MLTITFKIPIGPLQDCEEDTDARDSLTVLGTADWRKEEEGWWVESLVGGVTAWEEDSVTAVGWTRGE